MNQQRLRRIATLGSFNLLTSRNVAILAGTREDAAVPDAIDSLFEQDPPTLSAAVVADRLGTTPKTVYGWLRDGLIPGYRVGTTWFILREELKETLRRSANVPRGTGPEIVLRTEPPEGE